ncbi:MAG: sigma-70 family RNA polymerase sigma factor [Paramuribaculum sp.]|nr:sigma-70 family RNA polymerase sigma factor [Paramuribaculum sp.]MDE7471784.1 sigma-70 family RNA polymerase sigma factor [Paramuribaculum sp.]
MERYTDQPDDCLVSAYANGDNEAFDTLLRRHQARIISYIFSVVKNRDVADDLTQETFVKALMTIKQGRYYETGKFGAWVSRIAHNLIIDYYRQEKAENLVSVDDCESDMLNRKELSDKTIEEHLMSHQLKADLRHLIAELPQTQREVLNMRYYRDMSFKEIADATNVSINTALGRMRYALLNMRKIAERKDIALRV